MKVLQVINSLATGGAEKLLLDTIPLYNKMGIHTDLLILNGTNFPFLTKLKNIKCCKIFDLGTGSVFNPLLIFKIIPYLKKYDVAHAHLFPTQYWVVLAKLISFSKITLVFTEHCTINRRRVNPFFKLIDKFIYKHVEKIVCITNEVQKILLNYTKMDLVKFPIINNGIDVSYYKEANSISRSEIDINLTVSDKLIVQIAGFREQKDQITLIKAMRYLPDGVKLLLVGEGVLKSTCEDLVNKLELNERVFFLGVRTDIPELLKTVDIVVLSSKYEGLSLSCIEGMVSGKPFIASKVPGLTEIVEGAGLLFECCNEKELAFYVQELLDNPTHYEKVAKACQERGMQHNIQIMVEKHISLYKSL